MSLPDQHRTTATPAGHRHGSRTPPKPLVLASSSPYRRALLERLGIPFAIHAPAIDESPRPRESATDLVRRLSRAKAAAVADTLAATDEAWIIGSDQVVVIDGQALSKPGDPAAARAQLAAASGRTLTFHTGLCLVSTDRKHRFDAVVDTRARFRNLDADTIARYVEADNPLDCAGSFRAEGLGISLLETCSSEDPTALIGLPLIRLADFLRRAGYVLP